MHKRCIIFLVSILFAIVFVKASEQVNNEAKTALLNSNFYQQVTQKYGHIVHFDLKHLIEHASKMNSDRFIEIRGYDSSQTNLELKNIKPKAIIFFELSPSNEILDNLFIISLGDQQTMGDILINNQWFIGEKKDANDKGLLIPYTTTHTNTKGSRINLSDNNFRPHISSGSYCNGIGNAIVTNAACLALGGVPVLGPVFGITCAIGSIACAGK
ncbi:unnamed protein product [Adineta ricciae]|uniref:Uncharacterized protein n=1 Tax=Adineta ricciae TaxID=249248 RepID=A0A815UID2_ADIRI|nr:unnamed protein product [Adineta ricciae]